MARGLRRCFGLRTAVATAFADNEVGRLLEDLVLTGGVDTSLIRWVPYDRIGRRVRNGLNFTERGFGVRGALGVSDRGLSAASQLSPDDIHWDHLFDELGVRWLHTGGIYAGLSDRAPEVALAAMTAARRHGTAVSRDLNYRPSLWQTAGGAGRGAGDQPAPGGARRRPDRERGGLRCRPRVHGRGDGRVVQRPGHRGLPRHDRAGDRRTRCRRGDRHHAAGGAQRHRERLGAIAWSPASGFVEAEHRPGLEILDRVGGGDSFASGLIYGLLTGESLASAVEYGAAHGALAMTTPGDTSMASLAEVRALVAGDHARVQR